MPLRLFGALFRSSTRKTVDCVALHSCFHLLGQPWGANATSTPTTCACFLCRSIIADLATKRSPRFSRCRLDLSVTSSSTTRSTATRSSRLARAARRSRTYAKIVALFVKLKRIASSALRGLQSKSRQILDERFRHGQSARGFTRLGLTVAPPGKIRTCQKSTAAHA
ncbi:hypothetical protein PF007_g25367 [Phytophthora fragariae]|uniref:Uncharacterized protein n=1 Tax=Phytophthora fragariae TaxID=53985 RepID=A0A6A3DLX8_9STRA|nr:hypothetical protein PF003_g19511 [Phytophthora fragariae]KAE8923054.1 hypothetical protein PF009_g26691 [Phytophthora fragariae]KAE9074544.1 hypothetical protein PF007_g25367 [Phytophthora fragariae]KAE9278198.1 hypothetical protein PF001_g25279 [Phytophthora fragariae]KAE9293782.1 hypothetical protein PF008_g24712 [Phytophthora fragariae]